MKKKMSMFCAVLALMFVFPTLVFAGAGPILDDEIQGILILELFDKVETLEKKLDSSSKRIVALDARVQELEVTTAKQEASIIWLQNVVIPTALDAAQLNSSKLEALQDWVLEHDFEIYMLEQWANPLQDAGFRAEYGDNVEKPIVLIDTVDGSTYNLSWSTSYTVDMVNWLVNWTGQNEYKIDAAWKMYGQFYEWLTKASSRIIFSSFEVFVYTSLDGSMPIALGMTQSTLANVAGKSAECDSAITGLNGEVGEIQTWINTWGGILEPFMLYTDVFGTNHLQFDGNFVISGALVANDLDVEEVGSFGGQVSASKFVTVPASPNGGGGGGSIPAP